MAFHGVKPDLKPQAGALQAIPPMPASLPGTMRDDWQTIAADLCERRLLAPSSISTLEAYLRSLWITRKAQEAIEQHGFLIEGKANPAMTAIYKEQATIARLAAELGLTPSMRSRAGFQKMETETPETDDDLGL